MARETRECKNCLCAYCFNDDCEISCSANYVCKFKPVECNDFVPIDKAKEA